MTFSVESSLFHLLHRATQQVDTLFSNEQGTVEDSELTFRQLVVLSAVADREGGNQTGIVDATGVDRSTLADIVKRLTQKGLLARKRTKSDARAYAVKLTPRGRDALFSHAAIAKRAEHAALSHLSAKQQEELVRSLAALAQVSTRKSLE